MGDCHDHDCYGDPDLEGAWDDCSETILLSGGPLGGERHRLKGFAVPDRVGLPVEGGMLAWYRVDDAAGVGWFEGLAPAGLRG